MTTMETDKPDTGNNVIDEGLYSRQLYVMGHEAQQKITSSKVLIVGLSGLGVEVAKNVILAGAKEVVLHDEKIVDSRDVSSNYYVDESDKGISRASACAAKLAGLNSYVEVSVLGGYLNPVEDSFGGFTVVCVTELPLNASVRSWLLPVGDVCHKIGTKFICGEIAGLFSYCFCDFGEKFVVVDKDGEQSSTCLISALTLETVKEVKVFSVTVHEEGRHGLETGDVIRFTELTKGYSILNGQEYPVKVTGPFTFNIDIVESNIKEVTEAWEGGGHIQQVKQPIEMSFKSFSKALKQPGELLITDFAKLDRPQVLHCLFQALHSYKEKHANCSPCESELQMDQLEGLYQEFTIIFGENGESNESNLRRLVYAFGAGCIADLAPMASFLGGVMGQEILKACSHKFTPLNQFLYFDAVECLPYWGVATENDPKQWEDFIEGLKATQRKGNTELQNSGEARVFGEAFAEQLGMLNMFLVGAGAIGCEMLKNWAMMGVACGTKGLITVTDMDRIERSNLNRQFLFRGDDVGKSKSVAAASAVKKLNPTIKIKGLEDKVGQETEDIFGDDFMSTLDMVCTALDNVDARLYVDSRCLYYQKPMLESGTLGTKGNTQIVVPHLTENYGASRDPPEKEVPICTLKNFPYRIEHTLQWARELFEGDFDLNVETVNKFLKAKAAEDILKSSQFTSLNDNVKITSLNNVLVTLTESKAETFEDCVKWARLKFEDTFSSQIKQLLHNFPSGTVTSSGSLFWSGTKREPRALEFNAEDPTHIGFVAAAANLRAFNFGLNGSRDIAQIAKIACGVHVPEFRPKGDLKIAVNDAELKEDEENGMEVNDLDSVTDDLVNKISAAIAVNSRLVSSGLTSAEFEKDDDSNFHMDFITAAANLRARNYGIEEVDAHKAKMIAGRIIPAIATTTALVTGLVCFELYKLVAGKSEAEAYKNGFVNLALPLFAFSEPIQVTKQKVGSFEWSIWDRLEVDAREKELTLQEFVKYFEDKFSVEVSMVTFGNFMLDSAFTPPAKRKARLSMTMTQLAEHIGKKTIDADQRVLSFDLCCADENGEDVELPSIQYRIR